MLAASAFAAMLLSAPAAFGQCAFAGMGGQGLMVAYDCSSGGCEVRYARADAVCYDEYGAPGTAYLELNHWISSGMVSPWVSEYNALVGARIESCLDTFGQPNTCFNNSAHAYISDPDGYVWIDETQSYGGDCCGALWPGCR